MIDYLSIEQRLRESLDLEARPIAIALLERAPDGVAAFVGSEPSTCSYWRRAAAGEVFCTVPRDHYNCAIGCHTHNIDLPSARSSELADALAFMVDVDYMKMDEVPDIPRLPESPGAIVYAPLGDTPVDPDVVLVAGRPGRLMLLKEAALRAGLAPGIPIMGRPTCMAIPAALATGVVTSAGCIGNRVYTDLPEDQLYMALRGRDLTAVTAELATVERANHVLHDYHLARKAKLTSSAGGLV